jgi:hypothetical protein
MSSLSHYQDTAAALAGIYGQTMGAFSMIIFILEVDPLLGALGSAGAVAISGPGDGGAVQL